MLLQPTDKARLELHPGVQTLALRERSVLLLAHGSSSPMKLRRLFNGMGAQILQDLLRQGYLATVPDRCEQRAQPEEVQQSLDNHLECHVPTHSHRERRNGSLQAGGSSRD